MEPSRIFRDDLLAGQVILLSGGGAGLGRATALELAALGAQVTICGRRAEPLAETAGMAPEGAIDTAVCDVREEDQVTALVAGVLERHGKINTLVNNAGGQFLAPAESISAKGFRTVIKLNVESAWLMSHAVATQSMIAARHGRIINVTLSPHNGMPGMVHSGAARAAVENMTRTLATEWARYGIIVNSVAAGQIATETLLTKYPAPMVAGMAATVPLGRLGDPLEIAWQIAYLASPAGDFTTGSVITIDGGRDNWLGAWPTVDMRDDAGVPLSEQRRER
jgi:citronellol/citronellal dehydrogenase